MNRNTIKYIAIIAMFIDHIAKLFVPNNTLLFVVMAFIGRFTAPTMCYFLAEGYLHTSSKFNYGKRLLIFGLISQLPYKLAFHSIITTNNYNMILTLFICFLILYVYENVDNLIIKWLLIIILTSVTYFFDMPVLAAVFTLTFYIFKADKRKQVIAYSIIALAGTVAIEAVRGVLLNPSIGIGNKLWQFGLLTFAPFIYIYNGKSGSRNLFNKWFFYIIYPLHLIILWIICR